MRKILLALPLFAAISITFVFGLSARIETEATAQIKSGPIPTPAPSIDPFSADEKAIIQDVSDIANRFEAAMTEKEPKWKLKKKSIARDSRGIRSPEKGGGEVFSVSSSFQFRKGNSIAYFEYGIKSPTSVDEVAESFQHGLERRARGIAKSVDRIGDRAVVMMDIPGAPSTSATLSFTKGKFKVSVGIDNQSKTREQNEEDAIRLGKLIEPLID